MTANDIILRARSVSDLPATQFVSHLDELNSINEAWKDLYSALVEADDDYYVTEVAVTLNSTFAIAGTVNEYLYPLPADFLKLRYLDFRGDANNYLPVKKFTMSQKDDQPGDPYYRIKGTNLWIIGGSVPSAGMTLRMGYYPAVQTITAQQADFVYGTSYAPNLFTAILAPAYATYLETMVYANGAVITSENIVNATVGAPVALFTDSGAVSNIVYYKGILYWIRGGFIWYKPTSLTAAFTAPTQATSPTGVTSFFIGNDTIYYSTAADIRSCTLTGASDVQLAPYIASSICYNTSDGGVYFTEATTNHFHKLFVANPLLTNSSKVTTDGNGIFFILETDGTVHQITVDSAFTVILTDNVIDTNVTQMGQVVYDINQNPATWIIPELKAGGPFQQLLGHDGAVNYNFSYPNNIVPEIMAWRSAIDYRTKQGADFSAHLLRLGHPTIDGEPSVGLWARFEQTIKRDEYQPERIRNAYADRSWPR